MIQKMDVLGASVVLSSYFFVATPNARDPANIFVVIPFLFGIAISIAGLSSHSEKRGLRIYLSIVSGIFPLTFIFMMVQPLGAMVMFYAAPVLLASSSLIMSYFAKNNKVKMSESKDAFPL